MTKMTLSSLQVRQERSDVNYRCVKWERSGAVLSSDDAGRRSAMCSDLLTGSLTPQELGKPASVRGERCVKCVMGGATILPHATAGSCSMTYTWIKGDGGDTHTTAVR